MGNKEDFKNNLTELLAKKNDKKKNVKDNNSRSVQKNTEQKNRPGRKSRMDDMNDNDKRTSLVIDRYLYKQICQIAVNNNFTVKDIMNSAMKNYIERYEKKYGPVTPRESNISPDELI